MKILVTGGTGFIGANFLSLLVPSHPQHQFVNVDNLTYTANLNNLESVAKASNCSLEWVDIADPDAVDAMFQRHQPAAR